MSTKSKLSVNTSANDTPVSSLSHIPSPSSLAANKASSVKEEELKSFIGSLFEQQNIRFAKIEQRIDEQQLSDRINNSSNNNNNRGNNDRAVKNEFEEMKSHGRTPASAAAAGSVNSDKQKKTNRLMKFFDRISEANAAKLGLSDAQLSELSTFMNEDSSDPASGAGSADMFGFDRDDDDAVGSHHTQFDSDLIPYKPGEKQTIEQALADVLKVKTKTIKRFESFDCLLTLFNKQLFTFITSDGAATARVHAWVKYYNFIMKLSFTHGLDAASDYHYKLFMKIDDEHYDWIQRGYYDAEIMRMIDTKYVKLTNVTKSKPRSALDNKNKTKNKFGNNNSDTKSNLYCSKHGKNSSHSTAQCYALNNSSSNSSASKPPAK